VWGGTIEVRRTEAQTRVAPEETVTPGYTIINVAASWRLGGARRNWDLFLRGTDLANASAREHGSFLKDFAPLPGRGIGGGVRLRY
jgi:iron complex outermembrane receptor protein